MTGADIVKGSERVSSLGANRFILFGVLHPPHQRFGVLFALAYIFSRPARFLVRVDIDECPAGVSCVPFTARSFVLFADLDEQQRFKNRIVLPRKVGRKEKDFVLYRPSLGGCVWMPDGSSELSGFQKRRRLKHTAS